MKKIFLILLLLFSFTRVYANFYINLDDFSYSTDNKKYNSIKVYESINDMENLPKIYITTFLYDGVSSYKTRDIDSDNEKELTLNVININTIGDIYLTGKSDDTMIAINTNGLVGNINIILDNVDIDSGTKRAPGIYIYNKDINYTKALVTIKTTKDSVNYIEGGNLKKVSLIPGDELDEYSKYYSNNELLEHEEYYGVYNSYQINNVLFGKFRVDDKEILKGDPVYLYKASGVISSDIDLYFDGEGKLIITSKNKEGIESKGNINFLDGSYEIYSVEDGINTTNSNGKCDINIDVDNLFVSVLDSDDRGDGIDSNGKLIINSGNIISLSHPTSSDSGLDSSKGTYINGGRVISTGNMIDPISEESSQNFIYVKFNKVVKANTLIVIKNQNDEIIGAYKTPKSTSTLVYSDSKLNYDSFKIYEGGNITGNEVNGLFDNITSYSDGKEIKYNIYNEENNHNWLLFIVIGLIIIISSCFIIYKHKRA